MTRTTIVRVWAGLVGATAWTWWLGGSGASRLGGVWGVALVLALAFIKGRWIALDFMELRTAPALWRRLMMGWLVGVLGLILACALWSSR